jgi:ABC-type transporter Mla subunit MlaD
MKRLLYTLVATAISLATFAQSSQKMSYQAVIRNANNQLVDNKQIGLKLSILRGSASGTVVYTETQTPTTNANGLMSVQFGGGAGYSSINWAADTYFVKTEVDPAGGTNYTITGASQFLSVPFALYAVSAGNSSSDAAIATAATSLTAETTRATAAEASLLASVNAASAQLTALVAKADSVKASYDANVLVLNDSITKLNAQIASLTADKAQLQSSLTTAQATITQLNTQLATTTQANAATIASLRTQLTTANNKVTALTATLGTKDATITALTIQVADLNTALANAEAKAIADKGALQRQINELTQNAEVNQDPNSYDYTRYVFNYITGFDGGLNGEQRITDPVLAGYFKTSVIAAYPIKGTILGGFSSDNEIIRIGKAVKTKGAALTNAEITALLTGIATTVHPLVGNTATLATQLATLQAQKTADSTASAATIAALTETVGQKNEVITSLSTQVQELGEALTSAQTQFSTEKASLESQIEQLNNQQANGFQALNNNPFDDNIYDKYILSTGIFGIAPFLGTDGLNNFKTSVIAAFPIKGGALSDAELKAMLTAMKTKNYAALTNAEITALITVANPKHPLVASIAALQSINAGTEVFADFATAGITGAVSAKKAVYDTAIKAAITTKGNSLTLAEIQTIVNNN